MKLYMKNINKIGVFLAISLIFFIVFIMSFSNKINLFDSSVKKLNLNEGTEVEVPLDNWELSTIFFDSTVDDGNTPLTEINWDASDGSYKEGETRIITMQINYKNTSTITSYNIGDLQIDVPNLIFNSDDSQLSKLVVIGANDDTHSEFDWNYSIEIEENDKNVDDLVEASLFTFTNNIEIEEMINFEGSIQIIYTLTPKNYCHRYEEEYTASLNKSFSATLNKSITSNKVSFNYLRNYIHPWQKNTATLDKMASKISSYDGMPNNASDYIWVKYNFDIYSLGRDDYPYIAFDSYKIKDSFDSDCIVLDKSLNILTPVDQVYTIDGSISYYGDNITSIYVGYPKSKYNDDNGNLNINNTAELYASYRDNENNFVYQSSDTISLNLANFEFVYSGNLYSIDKSFNQQMNGWYAPYYDYYQSLTGEYSSIGSNGIQNWSIYFSSTYADKNYDLRVGDDLLYITKEDGSYGKLEDDEYYFSQITFPTLKNGNSQTIDSNKYDCELWLRYANSSEYVKYSSFTNTQKTWNFYKSSKVVGFYFIIKNLSESVNVSSSNGLKVSTTIYNASDIAQNGYIYNFDYVQAYIDGELVNEPNITSYANFITKDTIAQNDMSTYGTYVQRDYSTARYRYYSNPTLIPKATVKKNLTSFSQNVSEQKFAGNYKVYTSFHSTSNFGMGIDGSDYVHFAEGDTLDPKYGFEGFDYYDLLPDGMNLTSTPEEILDTLSSEKALSLYGIDKKSVSKNSFIELVKQNSSIEVIENYKGTNRTLIHLTVDLSDYPIYYIFFEYGVYRSGYDIVFNYNFDLPYDSYLEFGNIWENEVDMFYLGNQFEAETTDVNDINENGNITEKYNYGVAEKTITAVVSTHQDVAKFVQTDKNNFSTAVVNSSVDSTYKYKLRVRTGKNPITNVIIYDNLEIPQVTKRSWKGEFLGVDTSYAESQGYVVKTYYSENEKAGTLVEDNSWKLYDDTINKSNVKSLAFEYLDTDGNPAVLPINSLSYVIVNMKSPNDLNIRSLSYNNCWTQWNAVNSITGENVDFITGINSNITKIALPNSVIPEMIELTLEKKWEDYGNVLGLRPDVVVYKLIANGDKENSIDITLSSGNESIDDVNHWIKTIEVEKYDDAGVEIIYSIEEEPIVIDGHLYYISNISGYSVTNTLSKELTITKKWVDNNNSYLTRPSNVTIKVLQNNKDYKDVVITGNYSTNEWANKITVPVYDSEGNEYVYTLKEEVVENYSSTYDSDTFTFTNILTGEEKIKVTKKWLDNSNSYTTRPSSVTVKLKQNDKDYQSLTLTGTTNTWISEEISLPKYDSNGVKYIYTIEEDVLVNGYGVIKYDQNNLIVTNTLKQNMEINITKKWLDNNNSYNTRPMNLEITILQNNKAYKTVTLSGNTDTWSSTIEVPKYDDNQKEYKYTIKELNENIITEYSDVNYSNDGLSVTNKLKKNMDLNITKKWIDYDNEYNTRSSIVKINLYQNGTLYKELELSGKSNIWTTKVEKVPVYDENGHKYSYTIEEETNDKLKKYQKITYDQTDLTVINELTEKPKVTLYFTVKNGYTEAGDDEVKFDEEGLKKVLEKHNINPGEEYLHKFELENVETGKKYEGSLSTQGILEFPDLPYGTYRAVEGEDEYFLFVNMLNIEDIPGVTFTEEKNGGLIKIEPTGEDIIYGVNVINKIKAPFVNPETKSGTITILVGVFIILIVCIVYFMRKKKEF